MAKVAKLDTPASDAPGASITNIIATTPAASRARVRMDSDLCCESERVFVKQRLGELIAELSGSCSLVENRIPYSFLVHCAAGKTKAAHTAQPWSYRYP